MFHEFSKRGFHSFSCGFNEFPHVSQLIFYSISISWFGMQCYLYDFYKILASKGGALVVMLLHKGTRRFTDLVTFSGLSEATLSLRLKELQEFGLIEHKDRIYELTPWGEAYSASFEDASKKIFGMGKRPKEVAAGRTGMFSVMSAVDLPRTYTEIEQYLVKDMGPTTMVRCLRRLKKIGVLKQEDNHYVLSETGRGVQDLLLATYKRARERGYETGPCLCGKDICLAFRHNALK